MKTHNPKKPYRTDFKTEKGLEIWYQQAPDTSMGDYIVMAEGGGELARFARLEDARRFLRGERDDGFCYCTDEQIRETTPEGATDTHNGRAWFCKRCSREVS